MPVCPFRITYQYGGASKLFDLEQKHDSYHGLELDRFAILDPIYHFGAPWQIFLIFEALIEGKIKTKTYLAKVD